MDRMRTLPVLFGLLVGCQPGGTGDGGPGDDVGGGDTGAFVDGSVQLTAAQAASVSTVFLASWQAQDIDATAATLHVQTDEGESWTVDATGGSATVWGLPPQTGFDLQLELTSASGATWSEPLSLESGPVRNDMPSFTVKSSYDAPLDGGLFITASVVTPAAAVIADDQGRLRWWAEIEDSAGASRARLSADGQSVLVLPTNHLGDDNGGLARFALDGTLLERVHVVGQHHDFVEHSDGTLGFLCYDIRTQGGNTVLGDKIVEVAPDGTQTEVWSAFDSFVPDPDALGGEGMGWSHLNAIDFDEARQAYQVSSLHFNAIMEIDRASGSLRWLLGSDDSDFVDERGGVELFDHSHQFQVLDDSILIFENSAPDQQDSGALELSFNAEEPVVDVLWRYRASPSLYTFSLGDVTRLDDGDTLITWSTNGTVAQVGPDGTERWRVTTPLGTALGYLDVLHGVAGR